MSFDAARLRELQAALRQKMADNKELADSFKIEDNTVIVEPAHKKAFDKNMADIKELKALIDQMEELRKVDDWGKAALETSVAAEAAVSAAQFQAAASAAPRYKTLGQAFIESPEFKALAGGRNGASMPVPFSVPTDDLLAYSYGVKDIYSALPTGTPGSFGTVQRDAIVQTPKRTTRVRDLFPARGTNAAVIEYFRVSGFTNNAAPVAERTGNDFAVKPQSTLTFVGEQAPVRTIAHWEAAHRNALADEPQLRSIIDNELLYGLRLEEDNQILNGTNTGEDLNGLLVATGVQQYSWSSGAVLPVPDTKADAIRRAATMAFLSYYEPTGVVLHPNDYEDIELTKNDQGSYLFAVSIQAGGEARLWRMPVVDTPAMTEGKALVGAFGTGAQLYDRESANIRIAEQHADFFVRNAVVILAEQRLAMAVKRPEAFVEVTFDVAPS